MRRFNEGSAMRIATVAAAAVLFAASAVAADNAAAPTPIALHCGHVVDTDAGKLLGESTIVVEGERIKAVHSGNDASAGAKVIDLSQATCLPGLIDGHTHLTGQTSPTAYSDRFRWNIADYAIRSTVYARRTLDAG